MSERVITPGTPEPTPQDDQPAATGSPAEEQAGLSDAIVAAITATSGVIRLEPTLSTLIRRHGRADGLVLSSHGRVVDVEVNVSTSSRHQARRTAIELQRTVAEVIAAHDLRSGTIEVSVLAIEELASA